MQALAGKKRILPKAESLIEQNSCLHGTVNFKTQLQYGNGVYWKWRTKKAEIKGYDPSTDIYDLGTCTVEQLVLGHDDKLYDYANYYVNDGKNPCFMSEAYYNYSMKVYQNNPVAWDYIVMVRP